MIDDRPFPPNRTEHAVPLFLCETLETENCENQNITKRRENLRLQFYYWWWIINRKSPNRQHYFSKRTNNSCKQIQCCRDLSIHPSRWTKNSINQYCTSNVETLWIMSLQFLSRGSGLLGKYSSKRLKLKLPGQPTTTTTTPTPSPLVLTRTFASKKVRIPNHLFSRKSCTEI